MIAPELGERGFRKRRNGFFRQANSGWTLIDFQASQFGTRDDVSFTINLGVSFPELQQADEGSPSLGRAHIRQRIGAVLDRRQDVWWDLHPTSDHAAIFAEVKEALGRAAIPWLEERAILDNVLAAARSDAQFIERWHLSRLSVLAQRIGSASLAEKLRALAQREAT
jgi:hypothetical protein